VETEIRVGAFAAIRPELTTLRWISPPPNQQEKGAGHDTF